MKKSPFFKVKDEYGGGITNMAEITAVLKWLVADGVFESGTGTDGEPWYKEKTGVSRDAIRASLEKYEALGNNNPLGKP